MSELSSEDLLRLNVLLANARAIRIDEQHMRVHGLGDEREYEVQLNPRGGEQAYLTRVREFLSTAMFGSPRRYPKYLHRWAGLGQISTVPVDKLLMLGEPEVMLAVAHSATLTAQQAQLAWWAYPGPELGRRLLHKHSLLAADFARELVRYLVEYLPFETQSRDILHTVSLVLATGLVSDALCLSMWNRGQRRKSYRIAFLNHGSAHIPQRQSARADLPAAHASLQDLAAHHPLAAKLHDLLDEPGQTFIAAVLDCLPRCADQEEVNALLEAMRAYFTLPALPVPAAIVEPSPLEQAAEQMLQSDGAIALLSTLPALHSTLRSMLVLSLVGPELTTPVFSRSDATGTVMRKQLAELTDFLQTHLRNLCA